MEKQKEKFRQLEENEDTAKVQEIKEKMAWKSILQKAEGQKIKDDPILLKKSIKKMVSRISSIPSQTIPHNIIICTYFKFYM